jgi:hypothetical protein
VNKENRKEEKIKRILESKEFIITIGLDIERRIIEY